MERFFKGYGRIRDIDLKRGFGFVVSRDTDSRGSGPGGAAVVFVLGLKRSFNGAMPPPHVVQEFDDPRDAEDAVYELDGKELCNERWDPEKA